MPLYEYISKSAGEAGKSCRMCSKGFELRRPVDRAPLEVCPLCKHPVKKVILTTLARPVANLVTLQTMNQIG